jgi:hypothetical protein
MKRMLALLLIVASTGCPVKAQEDLPAAPDLQEPIQLIPDEEPQATEPEVATPEIAPEGKKIEQAGANLKQRIRFRQVKTRALKDPVVQDHAAHVREMRTDAGKRNALRHYYEALYGRMMKIDSSLEPLIAERQALALQSLSQTRITPSILIEE